MLDGWKEYRLKDICEYTTGKLNSNAAVPNGKYPFFTCSPETYRINNYLFNKEAVILAGNNANGVFSIKLYKGKFNAYQRTYVMNANSEQLLNNKYLYYYLSLQLNNLKQISVGSATRFLTKTILDKIIIQVPNEHEEMIKIGDILYSLDKKIEVNNKINKTLEKMAQEIFKHWFVDFEFPNEDGEPYKSSGGEMVESELGLIPKGWEVGNIGKYMKVKSGFAFKSQWWQDEGVPIIKIKNLQNGIVNYDDVGYVSPDKKELASDFIVKSGDVLIAMTGATIGKIGLVYEFGNTVLVNQRVGKFFLGEDPFLKLPFSHVLLTNKRINDEIISLGEGSAQPNISPKQIESIKISYPDDDRIDIFNINLKPLYKMIVKNIKENRRLMELRDTLLPKLMSGQIRVPLNIDQQ